MARNIPDNAAGQGLPLFVQRWRAASQRRREDGAEDRVNRTLAKVRAGQTPSPLVVDGYGRDQQTLRGRTGSTRVADAVEELLRDF